METSPKYALNGEDLKKIGIGFAIALCGAALTYLSETIPNIDFGALTPLVMAFWSVIVNAARKFISGF